jgi:hypothetical protein
MTDSDPLLDQAKAASDDLRGRMSAVFGDMPPIQNVEDDNWVVVILDKIIAARTGMCKHLERTPAQPMYVTPYERFFRCQTCYEQDGLAQAAAARVGKARNFGAIEEGTCDRCRTFVGGDKLTGTVVRLGPWLIVMGLCPICSAKTQHEGGKMFGG